MIKLLIKKFIKNNEDVTNPNVKEKHGILCGILGIICNVFLFAIKLTIGLLINAFAIISDALNNLTDSFSSIVSIISSKLSNKKPDKNHPFGHGRIEYVATLIVAFIIIILGLELFIQGIKNLIYPNDIVYNFDHTTIILIAILFISLLVKIWMFSYNRYVSLKINSTILKATATDSLIDALVSFSIIISLTIGLLFFPKQYIYIDAILSALVSIFIFYNGFKIVRNTLNNLIGKPTNKEDKEQIKKVILEDNNVLGFHDLLVHEYGIDNKFASVHVELDASLNILDAHEIIDKIEKKCYELTKIYLTIHIDPINVNNDYNYVKEQLIYYLKPFKNVTFHDLRLLNQKDSVLILVDLIIPFDYQNKDKLISLLESHFKEPYILKINIINQVIDE